MPQIPPEAPFYSDIRFTGKYVAFSFQKFMDNKSLRSKIVREKSKDSLFDSS